MNESFDCHLLFQLLNNSSYIPLINFVCPIILIAIASLAGAGSLSIEMELLSRLTGDESFGKAAKLATRALWIRRSAGKSLLGKHIDVETGKWTEHSSGIGSNSDSFYEYLLKHYILYPEDKGFYDMFEEVYRGIFIHGRYVVYYYLIFIINNVHFFIFQMTHI